MTTEDRIRSEIAALESEYPTIAPISTAIVNAFADIDTEPTIYNVIYNTVNSDTDLRATVLKSSVSSYGDVDGIVYSTHNGTLIPEEIVCGACSPLFTLVAFKSVITCGTDLRSVDFESLRVAILRAPESHFCLDFGTVTAYTVCSVYVAISEICTVIACR